MQRLSLGNKEVKPVFGIPAYLDQVVWQRYEPFCCMHSVHHKHNCMQPGLLSMLVLIPKS